jgi:putative peptidoglycan lipid II flippase
MGRTTGLLVLLSLASQALSLGIQVALAHRFGAGTEVDAYVAALTLPGLMEVFLLAAVSQLLLPALVRRLDRGERQEAWRALATLVTVLGGGCLLLSIPVALSGPAIVRLTAPGLDPATRALAGDTSRASSRLALGVARRSSRRPSTPSAASGPPRDALASSSRWPR